MNEAPSPLLSVIVPVLNEVHNLPALAASLAAQQGVRLEWVICDGGSIDGTLEWVRGYQPRSPLPLTLVTAPPGRAAQLNRGAGQARGQYLLFAHADSRFPAADALAEGLAALRQAEAEGTRLAGHFALSFDLEPGTRHLGYYFYETKARSNRPGTIFGDQGYLLSAENFSRLGPFLDHYGMLEDWRFAQQVAGQGAWLLLPAEIVTSARRFQTEGLHRRQLLNALIVNFATIGWDEFFRQVPDLYRRHEAGKRLDLWPVFAWLRDRFKTLPAGERRRLWQQTGRFVRNQGWQLGLALDCRRNQRRGLPPGTGPMAWLGRFDRWFDRATDHRLGRYCSTQLVRLWFYLTLWRLAVGSKGRQNRPDGG